MNRQSPEAILKLARGFMESRILLSGAELNLFTLLARDRLTAPEIARRTASDLEALTVLLDALAAMGLLEKEEGAYHCPPAVAASLADGSPRTVLPMVLHGVHLWRRWTRLTDVVRGEDRVEAGGSFHRPDELRAFIGAMHVVAEPRAAEMAAAVHPGPAKALLDVGGASGTYTIALLRQASAMAATLFDRPEVIEMARERIREAGLLHRVRFVAGDFYRDELPSGHDLAFVSAIIHQNGPAQNRDLYGKVFRSLKEGGRIVIRDHVMEPDRVHPGDGAIFAVNMLLGTERGSTYTFAEIEADLAGSGFTKIGQIRQGERMDALVEAFKP